MNNNVNNTSSPIQKMVEDATRDRTFGPLIGSIIIVLLVMVGGIYFFGSLIMSKKATIQSHQAQTEKMETFQVEKTAQQSNSDDLSSIESDLNATSIDTLDTDFEKIEVEF